MKPFYDDAGRCACGSRIILPQELDSSGDVSAVCAECGKDRGVIKLGRWGEGFTDFDCRKYFQSCYECGSVHVYVNYKMYGSRYHMSCSVCGCSTDGVSLRDMARRWSEKDYFIGPIPKEKRESEESRVEFYKRCKIARREFYGNKGGDNFWEVPDSVSGEDASEVPQELVQASFNFDGEFTPKSFGGAL